MHFSSARPHPLQQATVGYSCYTVFPEYPGLQTTLRANSDQRDKGSRFEDNFSEGPLERVPTIRRESAPLSLQCEQDGCRRRGQFSLWSNHKLDTEVSSSQFSGLRLSESRSHHRRPPRSDWSGRRQSLVLLELPTAGLPCYSTAPHPL